MSLTSLERVAIISARLVQPIANYITFEQKLNRSLDRPVSDELYHVYLRYEPILNRLYGADELRSDLLYHGTGYKRYRGNKFTDEMTDEEEPLLESILMQGLIPSPDPWITTPGNIPTTSFTRARHYAKWYASKHHGESVHIDWEYGNTNDWFMYVFFKHYFSEIRHIDRLPVVALLLRRHFKNTQRNDEEFNIVHRWVRGVRNDITPQTKIADMFYGRSTIPDNWGAIIVVDRLRLSLLDMPMAGVFEERASVPTPPSSFIALEVPLRNVDQATRLTRSAGLSDLPVIPIECMEVHLSRFSLQQLTKNLRPPQTIFRKSAAEAPSIEQLEALDFSSLSRAAIEEASTGTYGVDYDPEILLRTLEQSSFLRDQYAGIVGWQGQSLRYHHHSGLLQLEKVITDRMSLPGNVRPAFLRAWVALHDTGKLIAKAREGKSKQLVYSRPIVRAFFTQLDYGVEEQSLADALISDDPIGYYLKRAGTILLLQRKILPIERTVFSGLIQRPLKKIEDETVARIETMNQSCNISLPELTDLLILLHKIDAGTYTFDGGSMGLEYLFANTRLDYVEPIRHLIERLRERIHQAYQSAS